MLVMEIMNVNQIPLYDFSDPQNPLPLDLPMMVLQNTPPNGVAEKTKDPQVVKLTCSYKLLHWAEEMVTP